jgi:hypothetical protein
MISPVTFTQQDRIGILRIDNPPVNAISAQTVEALVEGFDRFEATKDLAALVILCAGPPEQVEQRMGLLTGSLDYGALADCDLVIEAVFENLDLKKQVCERLAAIAKPSSAFPPSRIASRTTRKCAAIPPATGRRHLCSPASPRRSTPWPAGSRAESLHRSKGMP